MILRPFFQKAADNQSGVQGLLGLASFHLGDSDPDSLLKKLKAAKPLPAEKLFSKIRDTDLSREEDSLLVFITGGFPYEVQLLHAVLGGDLGKKEEALEILESWTCGNPDFPYVPLISPMEAAAAPRLSSPSGRANSTVQRNTAILVGGIASAALLSANTFLRS